MNVPISSRLADALSRVPRRLESEYVFTTSIGDAYKRIEKSFDFVSHASAQAVPIHVVARIVGRSTTRMTERHAHLIEGQELNAVERLPEWKSAGKEGVVAGDLADIRQIFRSVSPGLFTGEALPFILQWPMSVGT